MWRTSEAHLDRCAFVVDPILFRFSFIARLIESLILIGVFELARLGRMPSGCWLQFTH
jgi:hypothetical protein